MTISQKTKSKPNNLFQYKVQVVEELIYEYHIFSTDRGEALKDLQERHKIYDYEKSWLEKPKVKKIKLVSVTKSKWNKK